MSELASKIAKAGLFVGGKLSADKTNKDQAYDYISADKINTICGQALYKEGVAVLPEVTNQETVLFEYTDNYGKSKRRYDSTVTFKFTISDGSESIETSWVGVGSDYVVPDKAAYKAITSGHKYFLMKLLCVGAGNEDSEHEDNDGHGGKPDKQTTKPAAQPAQPKQNGGAPMTVEEAENIINSKGQRYGDIDSDTLRHMANAISKAKVSKPEHADKMLAIEIILRHRHELEVAQMNGQTEDG